MAGTQMIFRPLGRDLSRFVPPGSPDKVNEAPLTISPTEERFYMLPTAASTLANAMLGEFSRSKTRLSANDIREGTEWEGVSADSTQPVILIRLFSSTNEKLQFG
jgi:hypothetical protein